MNYIIIGLDTTAPIIEIIAPPYVDRVSNNTIIIESNEILSSYQEIYIIDSNGQRRDYTFLKEDTRLTGQLTFNEYPFGVATLYCKLEDAVGNKTALLQKSFEVREGASFKMEMHLLQMRNNLAIRENKNSLKLLQMKNNIIIKK